jgi:hypothetical protein
VEKSYRGIEREKEGGGGIIKYSIRREQVRLRI